MVLSLISALVEKRTKDCFGKLIDGKATALNNLKDAMYRPAAYFTHMALSLLPVMAVSYMFQFLDKSALSFTAILGLRDDLHLTSQEFSWVSAIYYFGYLVATAPASLVMMRWRVGNTIGSAM